MDNVIYQTCMSGVKSEEQLLQEQQDKWEQEMLDEWMFSDPIEYEECDWDFELTEDDIWKYDSVCEQYEEDKRKRLFEEQEY